MNFDGILNSIKGFFQPKILSPVPDSMLQDAPSPSVTPPRQMYRAIENQPFIKNGQPVQANAIQANAVGAKPQVSPVAAIPQAGNVQSGQGSNDNFDQVLAKIQAGFKQYGNPPAATAAATFAEEAMKYPRLRENPGMLPAMAIKETSGGKNTAYPNNWLNYGIYEPTYQPTDPNQVIRDVARALGSDASPSSHYYKKFRETGDIGDLLNRYAPPSENDTNLYHKQILDWKRMFE